MEGRAHWTDGTDGTASTDLKSGKPDWKRDEASRVRVAKYEAGFTIGGMQDDEAYYLSQIPKQQPSRVQVPKVSSILNRVIQQRGYAAVQSTQLLNEAWSEAVGSVLAGQTRVGKIERGALQVYASNKVVITELEFMKPQLLKVLQQKLPEFTLRSLRFRSDGYR